MPFCKKSCKSLKGSFSCGSVIGDRTVIFADDNNRIELTHKASSRGIFAQGAIAAAKFCTNKPNGFYGMKDLLGGV